MSGSGPLHKGTLSRHKGKVFIQTGVMNYSAVMSRACWLAGDDQSKTLTHRPAGPTEVCLRSRVYQWPSNGSVQGQYSDPPSLECVLPHIQDPAVALSQGSQPLCSMNYTSPLEL